jgi:hypothetical protein
MFKYNVIESLAEFNKGFLTQKENCFLYRKNETNLKSYRLCDRSKNEGN